MIAGIITVPSRAVELAELVAIIRPEVRELRIYTDYERRGHWWNYGRMLSDILPAAKKGEPVLTMSDDVITKRGWRNYWEQMHKRAGMDIYTLFSRQSRLFTAEALNRGYVTGRPLRGLYDVACIWIDHPTLFADAMAWMETQDIATKWPRGRHKHLDVIIQDYVISTGRPFVTATPCLFDHRKIASTLGHTVGGATKYVGDMREVPFSFA